jgi:hypothetical protein
MSQIHLVHKFYEVDVVRLIFEMSADQLKYYALQEEGVVYGHTADAVQAIPA